MCVCVLLQFVTAILRFNSLLAESSFRHSRFATYSFASHSNKFQERNERLVALLVDIANHIFPPFILEQWTLHLV